MNDNQFRQFGDFLKTGSTSVPADNQERANRFMTPESNWPDINATGSSSRDSNNNSSASNNNYQIEKQHMSTCKRVKTVTKPVTVTNGTVAGTYSRQISLGKEFGRILGYYMIVSSNGGLSTSSTLQIGITDATGTLMDNTIADHYLVTTGFKIEDRFYRRSPIELVSGDINLSIVTGATLTSDLTIQFVAELEYK